ncbi:MAG: AarF/ABC1/UbiB kinase family protein [Euryarchaeota archaeon]|nr:AarF/ABC1/UbiB kinase family protein [Euryarchaeota archaeon]
MLGGGQLADEAGEPDLRGPLRRMLSDKYVHYKRVAEILAALSRFGFGRVWDSATLLRDLPFDSESRKELSEMRLPIRFRLFLEGLGPTFIKLGQMLSTRPDLVPEELAEELGNLRDNVPPMPFATVRETVEGELGRKLGEVFERFDEKPVAAASIGQVHKAVLKGKVETVAVKVQRSGIAETVRADMEILTDLAAVLERSFSGIEQFDVRGVIAEFGRMMQREMDYTIEARNIRRFSGNLGEMKEVTFPEVHWALSTRRVLTMGFIDGFTIDKRDRIDKLGLDPAALAQTLGRAYIRMIFLDGFFHADPHQGNLFVLADGRICFLDFGAIGYLDEAARDRVALFYISLIRGQVGRSARLLMELSGESERTVDLRGLEWDLRDFLDYNLLKRQRLPVSRGMNQRIVTIAMKHRVMLPSSFVLLERALAQVEGVCRGLDPAFDIVALAEQNLAMLLEERYRPGPDPLQAIETARGYRRLARELPARLERLFRKLEGGEVTIRVDPTLFDGVKASVRRAGLILAVTLMAASLVLYIGWEGRRIELELLGRSVGVGAVFLAWLAAVAFLARRK